MLFKLQQDSPDKHILNIFSCVSSFFLLYTNMAFFCLGKGTSRILEKQKILKSEIVC